MAGRRIVVEFLGQDKSLSKTANSVETKTSRMGGKLATVGKAAGAGIAAAGVGAVLFGKAVLTSASDAQQSLGATETVFGKFAQSVITNSNNAATAVGLSASSYRENANLIGSLFKNQGVASDELAGKTDEMIKLGADLAATFGGTTKESVEALGSAFKGEYDPLERYGISLKQSTVNAEAMRLAHVKSQAEFDKLSTAQQTAYKQQAASNLIMKQSADSSGAFARESDTLAGAQQRLGAKFENLKSTIGEKLLPVATKVVTWASDLVDKFQGAGGAGDRFKEIFARIGEVIRPIGDWFKNDLVPTIKDLSQRFWDAMGGTDGLKKSFEDMKPALDFIWNALKVLWEGLKAAARVAIPIVVANLKVMATTVGALGRTATWLWNNAFQPALRFIGLGVSSVLTLFSKFLAALGRVPGFGWAKDAADKLERAAKKAKDFAESIEDIPSSKEVKIKVKYSNNNGIGSAGQANFPRNARGTNNWGGGPTWVGEEGPEIVAPPRGSRIIPAGRSAKMSSGGTVTHILDLRLNGKTLRKMLLEEKRAINAPLGLA